MSTSSRLAVRRSERAFSARRALVQVHLWTGLVLCTPFVLLGLTGSVLVFHHELNDLLAPPFEASASDTWRSAGEIVEAGRAAAPDGSRLAGLFMPEQPGEAAQLRFARSGAAAPVAGGGPGMLQVFVDPATLAVLGTREGAALAEPLRTIHRLHANLLIDGRDGRTIIGWFGVGMLLMGLSGLVIWWPRSGAWRGAFGIKRGARGARFHRDLHGATGIWCFLVFVVVSFSGVHLAFPETTASLITAVLPGRDLRTTANALKTAPVEGARPAGIDQVTALALAAAPGTRLSYAMMPQRPDQPVRVALARPGFEHGQPLVIAFIDPWAMRVLELRDPATYTAGETVMAWQRALHAGEGLGWVYKILVVVSGFLPLLFAVTGVSMWLLKRRARRAREIVEG